MKLKVASKVSVEFEKIRSSYLNRDVALTIILPPNYQQKPYPVLWLNDGQDIPSMGLNEVINNLLMEDIITPFIVI